MLIYFGIETWTTYFQEAIWVAWKRTIVKIMWRSPRKPSLATVADEAILCKTIWPAHIERWSAFSRWTIAVSELRMRYPSAWHVCFAWLLLLLRLKTHPATFGRAIETCAHEIHARTIFFHAICRLSFLSHHYHYHHPLPWLSLSSSRSSFAVLDWVVSSLANTRILPCPT